MLLLTAEQVESCLVIRQNIFEEIVLSGLAYQGRLFFRLGQYPLTLEDQARQKATQAFRESGEKFVILMVQLQEHWMLWQEDPELKRCSVEMAQQKRLEQIDLAQLVHRIRQTQVLEIRDRRLALTAGLRVHKRCFRGDQFLDCLVQECRVNRRDALQLGQRLMDEGQLYQLQHSSVFEDSKVLYRFYEDEL